MSPMVFEPTVSTSERPQTYALNRAATGIENHTTLLTSNMALNMLPCIAEDVIFYFNNSERVKELPQIQLSSSGQ